MKNGLKKSAQVLLSLSWIIFPAGSLAGTMTISGDFEGNGTTMTLTLQSPKSKTGQWKLLSSNPRLPPFTFKGGEVRIISEGKLQQGKKAAFSVYEGASDGCGAKWSTFGLSNDKWVALFPPIFLGWGCNLEPENMDKVIFEEKGVVYILGAIDPDTGTPAKTRLTLKKW